MHYLKLSNKEYSDASKSQMSHKTTKTAKHKIYLGEKLLISHFPLVIDYTTV